jgi:hypothetical protein
VAIPDLLAQGAWCCHPVISQILGR